MDKLLNKLLSTPTENEVLEFKEAKEKYNSDKLGRYFSALSNEANLNNSSCAYLLMGVKDNKEVVGTRISDDKINDFKKEIAEHTSPNSSFINVHQCSSNGKKVFIFEIPPAPQGSPIAWKGHRYGRNGESLGGLNDLEYDKIREQVKLFDWSSQIIAEANIHDLDSDAISSARKQYIDKNLKLKEEIISWDDVTFLNKAKITIQSKITNAALLMLGKSESEHFISPAQSKISWILKDLNGTEKDYEHFGMPLFLNAPKVFDKIRNLKYRYMISGTLFPEEVDQFEPYIIREALNNCIAHQDYTMSGKINVVEREDGILVFSNSGEFIPKSIESVIKADAPENQYRNPFLAAMMVNLNMIDTIGSGIKKMFSLQKGKYFPLPDYEFERSKVTLTIIGKVVDENYARKLAQVPDLSLIDIMMLDKVAKKIGLRDDEITQLRKKGLIEGRKPNFYVSSTVAKVVGEKAKYIKTRAQDDEFYKKLILDYLKNYPNSSRIDLNDLLFDKLGGIFNDEQKYTKISHLITNLRRAGKIINAGSKKKPKWKIAE